MCFMLFVLHVLLYVSGELCVAIAKSPIVSCQAKCVKSLRFVLCLIECFPSCVCPLFV